MAKQSITLKIENVSFALEIESEKEELYRVAERRVNDQIKLIAKHFQKWDNTKCMAMALLSLAIKNVTAERSRELDTEEIARLKALQTSIDTCLNEPER